MKKILALFMSALLFLSVAACGNTGTEKTGITSPDDLDGKKVAVQMATTADDYLTELVESGRDIEILRYEKVTQCFDDLKFKRVDAVLVDRVVASYYMDDNSTSEIVWKNDEGEPMAICLKKRNDKLTEAVEKAIDTLYYNGKIGELAEKHFGDNYTEGLRNVTQEPVIDKEGFTLVEEGKFKVGMEVGYPPMEYFAADGVTQTGFDVDISKEIAELLGLELEIVDVAWDGIFAGLDTNKYDAVISSVSITPERLEKYNLTDAYVSNQLVLVVNK